VSVLKKLYRLWIKFSEILGYITTRIVLFLFYFIIVGIMAMLTRIAGKDLLNRKMNPADSYWSPKEIYPETDDMYHRQF
jgi:hypothetical protein